MPMPLSCRERVSVSWFRTARKVRTEGPAVFYRVADELIEDEAKPFFIGKYGVLRLMHLKGDPVLQQEILVLPYGLVDCVKEPEFPDEIVLFRVFAAGVVEGLLGVAINGLQGGQQCRGSGAGWFSQRSLLAAMGVLTS